MSLLPSATFAGPSEAEAFWAVAGSTGPGGGVTQLVAGAGVTLDPATGEGVVTISATGGGGGGVTSVTATGAGITATPTTGAVVVANTGVTSIVAGSGILASSATGAVTLEATFPQLLATNTAVLSTNPVAPTVANADICNVILTAIDANNARGFIYSNAWSLTNDAFIFQVSSIAGGVADSTSLGVQVLKNDTPGSPNIQISVYSTVGFLPPFNEGNIRVRGQLIRLAGRGL